MGIPPHLCFACDQVLTPEHECTPEDLARARRRRAEALGTPTLWAVPDRPSFPLLEAIDQEIDDD